MRAGRIPPEENQQAEGLVPMMRHYWAQPIRHNFNRLLNAWRHAEARKVAQLDPNTYPWLISKAQGRLELIDEILSEGFIEKIVKYMQRGTDANSE